MATYTRTDLDRITQLLHDARLQNAIWDRAATTLKLRFDCLRLTPDGSEVDDRIVEFTMTGVSAIAAGYDSASIETRPSQFNLPQRITPDDLATWPFRTQEGSLSINSDTMEDVLDSARIDWLAGDEHSLRSAPLTFCLKFDQWRDFGMPVIHVRLLAAGDDFTIASGGAPLDLDEWEKQFEAWWHAWEQHWARDRKVGDAEDEPGEYDAAIPAGESPPPDPTYRSPAEPVFSLEANDAPAHLIRPLRDWFNAWHAPDEERAARPDPHPDESYPPPAERSAHSTPGQDFGRWGYARGIDQWWEEGRRACVVVRGIEHVMASEGEPSRNSEAVWTFALRQRGDDWIVDGYEQGWPRFGSAPAKPAREKPWIERWRSGAIER